MNGNLVSVIMPVYNGEKFLVGAINSILNQTYENLELILVNNNSRDNSIYLAESLNESRIRIINNNSTNPFSGYNLGIDHSQGEYIAFMDQDDICVKNRIETQLSYITQNALDLCGSFYNIISEDDKIIEARFLPVEANDIRKELLYKNFTIFNPTVVVKRQVFDKYGKFNVDLFPSSDYDFYLRIINYVKISNVPEYLYSWRINRKSVSHTNKTMVYQKTLQISINNLKDCYKIESDYWFNKSLIFYYNNKFIPAIVSLLKSIVYEGRSRNKFLYLLIYVFLCWPIKIVRRYELTYFRAFRELRNGVKKYFE